MCQLMGRKIYIASSRHHVYLLNRHFTRNELDGKIPGRQNVSSKSGVRSAGNEGQGGRIVGATDGRWSCERVGRTVLHPRTILEPKLSIKIVKYEGRFVKYVRDNDLKANVPQDVLRFKHHLWGIVVGHNVQREDIGDICVSEWAGFARRWSGPRDRTLRMASREPLRLEDRRCTRGSSVPVDKGGVNCD